MSDALRRSLMLTAVAATIAFNALAQLLPLNGRTTGEISDRFEIHITPAGYVFSIWSLIYAGLVALALFNLRASGTAAGRLQAIVWPFLASAIANMSWLALWHYGYVGANLVAMLALLSALAVMYVRLGRDPARSAAERWCVDRPISVYCGWITVATLVNLSVVLEAHALRPFALTAAEWAIVMLAATLVIAVVATRLRGDRWYLAVLVWATLGIAAADEQVAVVAAVAGCVAVVITILALYAPRLTRAS